MLSKMPDKTKSKKRAVKEADPAEQQFTQIKNKDPSPATEEFEENTLRSWLLILLIFVTAIGLLTLVYFSFPQLNKEESGYIKLPRNIEDAKNLGRVLSRYKDSYYSQVLIGVFVTYIFLQSFAIPGSIFLSILTGFLFPFPLALFLVCLCSGIGATFCYLLSYLVGRKLVKKYMPERVKDWQRHVNNHKEHLFNYILFLRITPFLPNWFINIASPVINVPLLPFFIGTFFGVAPPSFVAIQAGTTLYQLTSSGDAISFKSVIILGIFAVVSLLPVLLKNKLKKKFD